jgi:hypothetical protein
MRRFLVTATVVLVTALTTVPALAREQALDVDTKRVVFDTITAPGDTYSDAITITNVGDEPVALELATTLRKPKDWDQSFSPFIVEETQLGGVPDPCEAPLAPGEFCVVYLTFQTDRAGAFAGTLWINDTYRIKLSATAT